MALTDENGGGTNTTMLVQPSGFGGNDGFMGGNGWWIILLFILLGGWGNGFGGGFGGGDLYPWMNNSQNINSGFRDQMLNDNITSIRDGVYGISNQLCNGFAGTNAAITGAQNALAQQMYSNQIADMQQNFALQSQLAQCCCDNRAATADLKYTVATENCADRTAAAQNTRDIIEAQTRGTQAIIDKLCALELDGVKNQLAQAQRENVGLQNQLNMAALRESQTAQNAFIQQGFSNEVDALYNRLNSCPVPTTPVYGRTPIFTCGGQTVGCGCGGNTFVNG
ncbi:MAG: hypothetical protein II160_05155 [Selenomonas sp.]|nr:hypothetical protein [Selenomonas sp.]